MLVLTIRTDKPESEVGLYDGETQLAYETWEAHRQLAETVHGKIRDILAGQNKSLTDLAEIACYSGPGSFTGLRIGITVANGLAYALQIPIVAETGGEWKQAAIHALETASAGVFVLPEYGAPVNITQPKK